MKLSRWIPFSFALAMACIAWSAPATEPDWTPTSVASQMNGQTTWLYFSKPNLAKVPGFFAPNGWQVLFPATLGQGTRFYAALRQGTPVATPITPTTPEAKGLAYSISQSEVLYVSSQTGTPLQPRTWTFGGDGQSRSGYNAAFAIPQDLPIGNYKLSEAATDGSGAISHVATVTSDKYRTITLSPGSDLQNAIATASDYTRFGLSGDYTISKQPFVWGHIQLIGNPSARVLIAPPIPAGATSWTGLFGTWNTTPTASVYAANIHFLGVHGGKLTPQGKTNIAAAYVSFGSYHAYNCQYGEMDMGVELDSTPSSQASGVLIEGCQANDGTMYGCPIWLGGQNIDVNNCLLGPSRLEHSIRSSILNLSTNQIPRLVRVANCTIDGTHTSATNASPGKESGAFRDGQFFWVQNNTFVGYAECGQKDVNAWDKWSDYGFIGNKFIDPRTAPKTATLHVRAGTNGAGIVSGNSFSVPAVVTAKVVPTMTSNNP